MKLLTVISYRIKQPIWQFIAGLLLILTTVMLCITMLIPATEHLAGLDDQLARLHDSGQNHLTAITASADSDEFYRVLPRQESLSVLLQKIFDAANESGVTLSSGQFKLTPQAEGGFSTYLVALTASASYADIRRFVNRVLETNQTAALQTIDFSRSPSTDSKVESKVHFTLYLRGPET
jgi:Pilus assembly protein, PilO.